MASSPRLAVLEAAAWNDSGVNLALHELEDDFAVWLEDELEAVFEEAVE